MRGCHSGTYNLIVDTMIPLWYYYVNIGKGDYMIHIKEGDYHTLAEVAAKFNTNKIRISRIAKKLGLGLRLGRLSLRFHDDEVAKIGTILGY